MALACPWASSAWSLWAPQLTTRPLASAAAWCSGAAAWLAICWAVVVSPPGPLSRCRGDPADAEQLLGNSRYVGWPVASGHQCKRGQAHAAWSQAAMAAAGPAPRWARWLGNEVLS